MADSLVILPTYNEKENIEKMVRTIFALPQPFHVLVVDDGSPDGTAAIVKNLQAEFSDRLFLAERSGKLGLGTAYIHGFKWGLGRHYTHFIEMDCDFSHNPADLPRLLAPVAAGTAQLSIGSRYVRGGRVENWPVGRILMSYFASVYVRLVLWMRVKDTTAGFKCYHRRVLDSIDLDSIHFVGYAFQIEMKYRAWRKGFKLVEIPIVFTDRVAGASKMSSGIFKEALLGVLQMRFGL